VRFSLQSSGSDRTQATQAARVLAGQDAPYNRVHQKPASHSMFSRSNKTMHDKVFTLKPVL
jgi:hypothetical protein